jgi:hypothetical protein
MDNFSFKIPCFPPIGNESLHRSFSLCDSVGKSNDTLGWLRMEEPKRVDGGDEFLFIGILSGPRQILFTKGRGR